MHRTSWMDAAPQAHASPSPSAYGYTRLDTSMAASTQQQSLSASSNPSLSTSSSILSHHHGEHSTVSVSSTASDSSAPAKMDVIKSRYPYCVVWTPLPCISALLPFIGHVGICTSKGIIRDFAGPYYVSTDNMAFGTPTKYWVLDPSRVQSKQHDWDRAVAKASDEYACRMHNLFCDNCHSHVAMALNLMEYGGSSSWSTWKIGLLMLVHGRYVSSGALLRTWLPFLVLAAIVAIIVVFTR
ncbi:transmembrane protein [Capsaspora owczarzaki ATCC 30864]|uniref:Transmembrane protein n=1 Tax=Capsaspora owczarzaki (strain ATCC 30864) TaxID=595528 RepID=A0A0D2X1S7_CAPO3|nr:transmembrane protein [Capsaspora owczarzaki ATCC 30864]KJE91329.1 transmembrane protein [Capsaspora owczarzaki ATCC 30864]|eukprot:XP_004349231.2 transmembrane protein [Capsaspora owczarzaki ATCC 30864]